MTVSKKLRSHLLNTQQRMPDYLVSTTPESIEDRFLLIKILNLELQWVGLCIWDNELGKFHGEFNSNLEFHQKDLVIENYRWAGNTLYIYFAERNTDACIENLLSGENVHLEKC